MNEPLYQIHPGTVKVSGGTSAKAAGMCALRYFEEKKTPIEFLYIGANAGQQANKACSVAMREIERRHQVKVSFVPVRVRVETKVLNPTTGQQEIKDGLPLTTIKDAFVWRLQ